MKIAICNIPLQSDNNRTQFPPLGALAIIQSLHSAGYDASFYDIDFFRPSDEEVKNYFLKHKFDIIGISAIVSTSYKYVKRLTSIVRSVLPRAVVIVGGALTAASEVLLKFNDIDFCVIGEGEEIIVNLVNYVTLHGRDRLEEDLRKIKGLCFLGKRGDIIFTGYGRQLSVDEIRDPDYRIIEKNSNLDNFIIKLPIHHGYLHEFNFDGRVFQREREDKKLACIVTSRGCVNRCTFCHRWHRGIRIFSVDRIIRHILDLKENYNVGFLSFGDESFGTSKKWVEEIIENIKLLDLLYRIQGVCCENVNPELLRSLKESGCVSVQYGFESGSNKMLKVIEKRADVELNKKVARWTLEAGLQTVPALIVGMPGESYETINETSDFTKEVTESMPWEPQVTVKTVVVLPGAPVYEYARYRGLLGKTLEDEEKYLLRISDEGGGSLKQLNVTDYPYFIVQGWIQSICWAVYYNYHKKHNFPRVPIWKIFRSILQIVFRLRKKDKAFLSEIYGNPILYHLRYFISPISVLCQNFKGNKKLFFKRCLELAIWPFKKREFIDYISLRRFLFERAEHIRNHDPGSVQVLRLGR